MAVSKRFKRGGVLAAVTVLALTFASCDLLGLTKDTVADIEIAGTWVAGTNTMSISNSSYSIDDSSSFNWDYTCEIVEYSNDGFNAGETGEGNCGYAVVKFTVHPNSPTSIGKYTVLRWKNLDSSGTVTVSTSEGYGTYFDTAEAAAAGATATAGYFSFYSSSTKQ